MNLSVATIKPPTEPQPFHLTTEERGTLHKNLWQQRVEAEFDQENRVRQFKAKPFVAKTPFGPSKSTQPLTEIDDIVLNSDRRAVQRQVYENTKMEKQMAYEQAKRQFEIEEQVIIPRDHPFRYLSIRSSPLL